MRINELNRIATVESNASIAVDTANGTKRIRVGDLLNNFVITHVVSIPVDSSYCGKFNVIQKELSSLGTPSGYSVVGIGGFFGLGTNNDFIAWNTVYIEGSNLVIKFKMGQPDMPSETSIEIRVMLLLLKKFD